MQKKQTVYGSDFEWIGNIENDKTCGKGILISDCLIIKSYFVDLLPTGKSKIFYDTGDIYIGDIENNYFNGFGVLINNKLK